MTDGQATPGPTASGTESASGDPAGGGDRYGATDDDRFRMDLYELLHERAERERRWQFWRLAAGHLVVGAILAYAFTFDAWRFVALTPILYGVVVMDGLKHSVRMLYLQQRLIELEAKLSAREPLADWVSQYGLLGRGRQIEVWDVDLDGIPETFQYVLVLSVYLGLVVAGLIAWRPLAGDGLPITREFLLLGYASFSLLFAAVVAVGYVHYRRVRRRVGTAAAPSTVE